jgi:hypothetical protein
MPIIDDLLFWPRKVWSTFNAVTIINSDDNKAAAMRQAIKSLSCRDKIRCGPESVN